MRGAMPSSPMKMTRIGNQMRLKRTSNARGVRGVRGDKGNVRSPAIRAETSLCYGQSRHEDVPGYITHECANMDPRACAARCSARFAAQLALRFRRRGIELRAALDQSVAEFDVLHAADELKAQTTSAKRKCSSV